MKYILVLLLCLHLTSSFSQIDEHEKVEHFIKIWGLLKYYHPDISNGAYNVNKEFIQEYQKLPSLDTKEAFNKEMIAWIESYGTSDFDIKENFEQELFAKNQNFKWILESGYSAQLSQLLSDLKNNANYKSHYADIKKLSSSIDFSNDGALADFDYTNDVHRLLFLASFWNTMNYWNVNLHLTDTPWEQTLSKLIPAFSAEGKENFEKAKEHLFSKLNDSHSNYQYSYTLDSLDKFPNFGGRIINDSLVITSVYNTKIFQEDSLTKGDVIYAVDGVKLETYYNTKFSNVISASNKNHLRRAIEKTYLLASAKDSVLVSILKTNGQNKEQYIQLSPLAYPYQKYERLKPSESEDWKEISDKIGYINLNKIDKNQLKEAFRDFEHFKGVIIDLRNYPRNINIADIAKYLYPERTSFLKALTAVKPAYGNYGANAATSFIMDPFKAGKKNKNYFKGKVVLLVDRTTASMAEWMGMAIQASPNCITIGEQTFGAVMNRNEVPLMDGTKIDFTAVGAFYPNDEGVQRKGLRLDHEIKESALHYDSDLYIKKAIALIREK
ncbi:S41 family peptidase [Dokdonia sp. PRO95]|uniref:S41 family peptidase n=1 Tax=Dokdonia sp. PRO95 TaxID=1239415 RepID=UPI000551DA47|nr:S41 family peptidase [Dokdonia sp. PRO95]